MYAISINSLYKGKGLVGATRQTTKLHLILAATLKKSGGPKVKLQNCTKLHLILAATFKKSGGPQVKLQNYTDFECMPYHLFIFIREKGH